MSPVPFVGPAGGLPTAHDEERLLACLRTRIEAGLKTGTAYLEGRAPGRHARVRWEREESCAGRLDLRAKLGLGRSAWEELPSGCALAGRVAGGRWWPRTVFGIAVVVAASWRDLGGGGAGALSVAEAAEWHESRRAAWRRRWGSAPFFSAVAGRFAEAEPAAPCSDLALLAWQGGHWRWHEPAGGASALPLLFYPRTPAECAEAIEAHLDRGAASPRLAAGVARELGLPLAAVLDAAGKNLRRHALEYRSGQPLFYRS